MSEERVYSPDVWRSPPLMLAIHTRVVMKSGITVPKRTVTSDRTSEDDGHMRA